MTTGATQTGTPAPAARPLYAKLARRVGIATAVVLLGLIPSVILYAITGEAAATWATGSFIAGVTAVLMGGVPVAVRTAVVIGLLTPVAIVAGSQPLTAAALMALMCLMVGHLSRVGLQRATLLVPVFMAWMIIAPPTWGPTHAVDRADGAYLAWMGVIFLVGAITPVAILPFVLRKAHLPTPTPHPLRESMPYTVTITVLTSVSTFFVMRDNVEDAGAWLIATILVLAQVGDVGTVRRTIQRVIGTLLGLVAVAFVVAWVDSLTVIYVIGVVFAIAALTARLGPQYWLYMALITPTVVCLNASSSSQVANLGEQRAAATVIGAALVLLAAACTIAFAHLESRHGAAPTDVTGDPGSATA